jgi:tetratricopeptide (TPR) repeat protein
MSQRPTTTQNLQGDGTIASGRDTNIGQQHNHLHLPGHQTPDPPQRLTHGLGTAAHERFIGRTELLKALKKELRPGKNAAILPARAVHADGGVGKTTLAEHLGWQLFEKKVFDYVLLLGAVRPGDLELELSGLCETHLLNLPVQTAKDPEERYRGVLAFLKDLANARRTLLILDGADADEARSAVHALRQELPGCAFLITSRHADWGKGITGFRLDLFSEAEALTFLRERLAGVTASDETLRGIAQALDHLPLGLEIAASYIQDTHLKPAEWLAKWQQAPAATLTHHNADKLDYPVSLARVWEQSVARLPESARAWLAIFAWIAPRPAALLLKPFEALENWPQMRGDLTLLAKASLIRWEAEPSQILIHRLLQTCMRTAFPAVERQASLASCVSLLNNILPDPNWSREGWNLWEALNPHLQAVNTATELSNFKPQKTPLSCMLNQYGVWLYYRAQYVQAERLQRRALKIAELEFGQNHPDIACTLNNLSQLLHTTNQLEEAEELMHRALRIAEANYGSNHENVAACLNNLATLLQATNRLAEAEDSKRRVVAIFEACLGPDHQNVATALNNLAQLLQDTNRLVEAEELTLRALKIDEDSCGPNHPKVATDLNNLAALLMTTNRLTEAEEPMRRALRIDEASYGPDHPNVARDLNNLAQLLQTTNRMTEAEQLMRRALRIEETYYGSDHPNIGIRLNNLASLLYATNRLADAEKPMERVVEVFAHFTAQSGHVHPHLGTALVNYSTLLQATGHSQAKAFGRLFAALVAGGMSSEQIRSALGG